MIGLETPLVRQPNTALAVERVRMTRIALQQGLPFYRAIEEISEAEGKVLTNAGYRSFLKTHFGSSAWPYCADRPSNRRSAHSEERIRKLKKWSTEGISKREAMNRLAIGEVAMNRFLHRYFGACVWPLGTERALPKIEAEVEAEPSRPLIVPTTITDRMALDYINHRVEHDGVALGDVMAELEWVRYTWSLLCGLVRMRATTELTREEKTA